MNFNILRADMIHVTNKIICIKWIHFLIFPLSIIINF